VTAFWLSIPIGLLIVLAAVGIPYWITHRRMRPHHDLTESYEYLEAAGKTPEDAALGRPVPPRREGGQVVLPEPPSRGTGPAG
jgi:hypothetical protein